MKEKNFYTEAHAFVGAIRIFEYKKDESPKIDDVCDLLEISVEKGHLLSNKLKELGIIKFVESAFETRVCINDTSKIEELSKEIKEDKFSEELKKFKEKKKGLEQKVAEIQAKQKARKKDLFTVLDDKFKKQIDKNA
ncbi:MAG: hypothetical protein HQK76_18765 [Desulfobacterales bacterium]|nr:hypothetical protein [Desulfobacterales bacterium]